MTLKSIFKNEVVKKKLLITFGIILLVLLGSQIPTYGVNTSFFSSIFQENGTLNFFDALTGNSFSQLSLFALSITPYITASIVIQLLMVVFPSLSDMVKNNIDGKEKLDKITYITAGCLGYLEALAMSIGFGRQGLLISYTWYNCLIVTILWGTGALIVLLLGKLIDKYGIGNGISLILLFNILSSFPSDIMTIVNRFATEENMAIAISGVVIIILMFLVLFVMSIILNSAEKKIPVLYSKRGTFMGPQKNYIPIKVCIAGVLPVIFASSLMSLPVLIVNIGNISLSGVWNTIIQMLSSSNWFDFSNPVCLIGYLIYALLVIFFGYFYASISFSPYEIAENLKKSGGTIAGIRPGHSTAEYLSQQMKYLIFIGTFGLLVIATIPMIVTGILDIGSFSFGGTSIMIIASVILETKKQLETETLYLRTASKSYFNTSIFGSVFHKGGVE